MIPQGDRAAMLACDAALDLIAIRLYNAVGALDRRAVKREMDAARLNLTASLDAHRIVAGDLRR